MKKHDFKNCFDEYQLYAGQFAKEAVPIKKEQAKNTCEGITYRIPSLISAKDENGKEVVISVIDMSESGGDNGRIQVVSRISEDGGKSFGDMKIVLSLPVSKAPQKRDDFESAFAIDPILVQAENGDILMIVDIYPESKGFMNRFWLDKGSGYINIDGKNYMALYSGKTKVGGGAGNEGKPYTIREKGFVYTPDGKKTNYYVPQNHSAEYAFETVGDLYYAVGEPDYIETCPPMIPPEENGADIYCGNIFLSYNKGEFDIEKPTRIRKKEVSPEKEGEDFSKYYCIETKPAPLSVTVKNYLWVLRSKDMGKTWTKPIDITASVMKEDEIFLGTGPGVAICLKNQKEKKRNGRILAPVYTVRETAVLYSDDNGYTWKRSAGSENIDETQLCELTDGTLLCFGRQKKLGKTPLSISVDGAETWKKMPKTKLSAIKCQKSVISVPKEIYCEEMDKSRDYIIASNPSGTYQKNSKRFGGMLTIGVVNDDKSIKWLKQRKLHADGVKGETENFFAYSSMTVLKNGNIAVLFEAMPSGLAVYEQFTTSWLMGGEKAYSFPIPLKNRLGLSK